MPDISKVTLPSGGTYDIKDAWARERITSGVNMTIVWSSSDYASSSAPSTDKRATIPSGVTVYYNNGASSTTGTLTASANTKGTFYLIYSKSQVGDSDTFDEYVTYEPTSSTYAWEKIGDTQISLSNTATVLGTGTVFIGSASGTEVASTTKYMKATASGTAVGKTTKYLSAAASGTAISFPNATTTTYVSSVSATRKYLATENVPNMTSVGSASNWSFTMGTGNDSETLIISGANGSAPTLGTPIAAVTGLSESGSGSQVVTGFSSDTKSDALKTLGSASITNPTITLTANSSTATGRVTYVESLGTVTQPTISLAAESSSATGRAEFVQSLGTVTNPTIAVGASPDIVTVYTP